MTRLLDWFLSFPDAHPELRLQLLGGLLLASLLGGAIGWEREHSGKPAGLRTNILICMAATLLTDLSVRLAPSFGGPADPGRIAAQIVTGMGFLGAGTIIQTRGTVTGLTTAATLWIVAAIGMAEEHQHPDDPEGDHPAHGGAGVPLINDCVGRGGQR